MDAREELAAIQLQKKNMMLSLAKIRDMVYKGVVVNGVGNNTIEFVKGVLFVRLQGNLNSDNTSELETKLTDIIVTGGIKYLVFNISNSKIEERIDLFDRCNSLIKDNNGKMFICGLKNKIESIVSSNYEYCDKAVDELTVLKRICVC